MTDKEMAEVSWRKEDLWYKVNADESSYTKGFLSGLKIGKKEANQAIEQVFLKGLKQTKWHNLKSDPCDLPPLHTTVLNENCDKVVYIGDKWEKYSEYYEKSVEADTPIAWCEAIKYGCDETYYKE